MPHKRNPVSCEQICGLARVVRGNATAAFENIALWHERDISHSSVERIILPDSTILVDYMLARMADIVANMKVFPARMLKNLNSTQGLVFSGQVLQDLVEAGMPRKKPTKPSNLTPCKPGNPRPASRKKSQTIQTLKNI